MRQIEADLLVVTFHANTRKDDDLARKAARDLLPRSPYGRRCEPENHAHTTSPSEIDQLTASGLSHIARVRLVPARLTVRYD